LSELKEDFDRAVLSGSEHRIRRAALHLESVWTWVEKGTEVVSAIADSEDLDSATHRLAQAVGRAQSALLRQAGVFQRELNKIDQHRVHLGRTGLSSSDLVAWLRSLSADALAAHADEAHLLPLHPPFVQDQIALDVAEFELLERERAAAESTELPGAEATPTTHDLPIDEDDLSPLLDWHGVLAAVSTPLELRDALRGDDYALSAYRLSLLGLLGDPESSALQGPTADLARLPLQLEIEPRLVDPGMAAIALVSAGRLSPKETNDA